MLARCMEEHARLRGFLQQATTYARRAHEYEAGAETIQQMSARNLGEIRADEH